MERAIELARRSMLEDGGGPFGAIVVKDGVILAEGMNQVVSGTDPTAHAEVQAIRSACKKLGSHQLHGCIIYSSCEPCPMCLGAIYWARPDALYFSASHSDAAAAQFDDSFIYEEIKKDFPERKLKTKRIKSEKATGVFQLWLEKDSKIPY